MVTMLCLRGRLTLVHLCTAAAYPTSIHSLPGPRLPKGPLGGSNHLPNLEERFSFSFFFDHTVWHAESWFPDQGLNLHPPPGVEALNLNHWTAQEVPRREFF